MPRPCVLAVDVGSSSVRAIVFDAGLAPRATAQIPHPGRAVQDPRGLYIKSMDAMREAIRTARARGFAITAIAPAAYLHSILAVDRDGVPLTDLLTWADARAGTQAARLPAGLRKITGCPAHASYPIAKIRWLAENERAAFRKAACFLSAKSYLLAKWTERVVEDEATASASGLMNLSSGRWEAGALAVAGISATRLPMIVPCDAIAGYTTLVVTRRLGLARPVPVLAGAGDGIAASLGSGATGPGDTALTIGTTFALRRVGKRPLLDPEGALWCYRFPDRRFITGAASNNGAIVWAWLAGLFPREFPTWGAAARTGGSNFKPVPLLFYPHLLGERTPDWSVIPSGAVIGLRPGTNARAIARATLQGLCFQIRFCHESLERTAGRSRRIILSGGGHDPVTFPKILASALGRPLELSPEREATARGAAILGFQALGIPVRISASRQRCVAPDIRLHKKLVPLYDAYRKGLSALKPVWNALAAYERP